MISSGPCRGIGAVYLKSIFPVVKKGAYHLTNFLRQQSQLGCVIKACMISYKVIILCQNMWDQEAQNRSYDATWQTDLSYMLARQFL